MSGRNTKPVALTIAGSDCSGGAGLQADLKVWAALDVHGASVVTCLTAQNPGSFSCLEPATSRFVEDQLGSVLGSLKVKSIKTGMLYSRLIIEVVAKHLVRLRGRQLVVDPVMISSTGAPLMKPSAMKALVKSLLPLAKLITPNLEEASTLAKQSVRNPEEMREAAHIIFAKFGCAVLVKGGHLKTSEAIDLFYDGKKELLLSSPRIKRVSPPGTGCAYSSAITAYLAKGEPLESAVVLAKQYITKSFENVYKAGKFTFLD